MTAYLEKAKGLIETFPIVSIEVISQSKNANADALAKLVLTRDENYWMRCPWSSWLNSVSSSNQK